MDNDFIEVLRGGEDKLGKFVLPSDYTQKWDPRTTDMMYMAISCETDQPKIEAIIVFSLGAREHLLYENIQSISVGHKEKRLREITYKTVMSREDIENSLYVALVAGARSKYSRVSELLFFFVCALETSFSYVTLWIIHSRRLFPLQPLIHLYTTRFGMIYPQTTPSPSRPFYQVLQPDGEPVLAPFVMFQKRENVIAHGLRTLAQISELPLRKLEEIFDEDLDDVNNIDVVDGADGTGDDVAQHFDQFSESESEDDLRSDDDEYKLDRSELGKLEKMEKARAWQARPITRRSSANSPNWSPTSMDQLAKPIGANWGKGKSHKTKTEGRSPKPKSPLPKKPSRTLQSQSKRITRSMKNLSTEDNLSVSFNNLNLL
eukprot:Phypoly_transcript_10176.p1 GENE.Phypoly_transcript_10176~~Phypoly_transcript_10176.p1  ORF type:complete len:435 (+),score=64.96 Phypoly_transcript_10176:181-1305(+)